MRSILTFGASTSSTSINGRFARYTASKIRGVDILEMDLNNFQMPIFNVDRERSMGIPQEARLFKHVIDSSNGMIISLAEHNGSYTTAFKNILDWSSRLEGKLFSSRPLFLLSTSPGVRGARSVMKAASDYFPRLGAEIVTTFSLPSFHKNFLEPEGIVDDELRIAYEEKLAIFQRAMDG